MQKPIIPANENDRIKEVNSYNILDTLPEEEYDNIARLAAAICKTPTASITFIDTDRQYFKATFGIDVIETKRDVSFCAHAINKSEELMVVNDARIDNRFADNPLVLGAPSIIFYAGMPLVNADGYALGALCVFDNKPGELTEEQQTALKILSNQVIQLLDLRKKNRFLHEYQKKLELYATDMESFAYMASHDLKDPLRMINIFLQKLKKNHSDGLSEKAKECVDFSINASSKMTTLVNDLLDYAALDKDKMVSEDIDVSELIGDIISYHSVIFNEAKAIINYKELPHLRGSKTGLKIVLQNLLMNAVKFRRPNESFCLDIFVEEKELLWLFKIADNGIGIDAAYFEEIFKPFKSLHSQTSYKGSGLGLAACKKIIEQHGGKIWVESEIGKGSTFYFEIIK